MLAHLELELEPIDILSSNSRKLSYKRSLLLIRLVLVTGSAVSNYSERNAIRASLTMQPMAALAAAFMLTLQNTALRPHNTRRNKGLRAAATSEDLLAEAAALRREANAMEAAMEAEIAPPPPPPPPSKPKTVAGVSPSEALEWTGSAFAGAIELVQEDGSKRRTPAEWSPWYGDQKSIIFQRQLSLPLGIILEEAGGGAIRVAEVRPGGSGEERDIRPGDVLRACSAISSTIVYGNAMFPLDGANTKWRRTLAPCDMQPFEQVMEQVTSNEGTILLVLEREIK